MAAKNKSEYQGFEQGDIAVRKGRLCVITKINWDVNPPDVTVKMQDNGATVGTEFSRLQRPTHEDMLKMPMDKKQIQPITTSNNRKRSFIDAFFQERKQKFSSNTNKNTVNTNNCNNIPQITSNSTFERLLNDLANDEPPQKRSKLSHNIANAQGWYCSACTVENTDMETDKCYLCGTVRTFEEKIKYPIVSPVILPQEEKKENLENKKNHNNNIKNDVLTFITYNVWFNEELHIIERMEEIGKIIDHYSADIVCLQEVTPLILDIIQNGHWYKSNQYCSTILPQHAFFNGLRYFNVILTKHEFRNDAIQFKPFRNTQMGRHLVVTPIKYNNMIIYAATSHLESPVGEYGGGKKDKFSAERKQQLQYSLQLLDEIGDKNKNGNIIFGGDMNWCKASKNKENDGDMDKFLNNNWCDCYRQIHGNKNGYTYDAKTNGMLSGYLANRLDRILFKKNANLKLKSCEMIGREAIPNLTYVKTFKRKTGDEEKTLPVLPSDHYGLVAQFHVA